MKAAILQAQLEVMRNELDMNFSVRLKLKRETASALQF